MVRYSDELIDEIRTSNDIVDIISQYVTLKRSGRNYFGLCPFHKEKSPSFSVSPDKQIFHCFGCGAGGGCEAPVGRKTPSVSIILCFALRIAWSTVSTALGIVPHSATCARILITYAT